MAAHYQAAEVPKYGGNHHLSLALELSNELTQREAFLLEVYGPWLTSNGLSSNAQQLIRAIQNAAVHGLNPESYSLSQILRTVDVLNKMDMPMTGAQPMGDDGRQPDFGYLRDDLSHLMDTAFAQLATHLGQGVVDARETQRELYRDVPQVRIEALLESLHNGQTSAMQALNSVTPSQAEYQRLTARMRNLLTERASGMTRPVIADHGTLSAAMNHTDIMDIKYRLMETGELPYSTLLTPFFDETLTKAINRFQTRHGLKTNGMVDTTTRNALNLSIDEEIEAVALSLERWRWMPRELGSKHLFINIPDYRVLFRDGAETTLSMVSVVGALEHQTPAFSRDMSYMEFNPTWTVPKSITNRELIPKERRKPGYLLSRNFEFLKRKNNQLVVIPPEQVTREDFQRTPFPYYLRQRGGRNNALGRLKFMMPNPYAIYLHDTQAKSHFTLNDRAYSHGCIRLSDPDALATLLMTEDGYDKSDIRRALRSNETLRVRLRSPIPTHLTYMTTWIDETGSLQRRADIYQHDAALKIALQASNTLLSILRKPIDTIEEPSMLSQGSF